MTLEYGHETLHHCGKRVKALFVEVTVEKLVRDVLGPPCYPE